MTYSAFSYYHYIAEPQSTEVEEALDKILIGANLDNCKLVMPLDLDEKLFALSANHPNVTIKIYASGEEPFDFSAKTFLNGKLIFFSNLNDLFPDLN